MSKTNLMERLSELMQEHEQLLHKKAAACSCGWTDPDQSPASPMVQKDVHEEHRRGEALRVLVKKENDLAKLDGLRQAVRLFAKYFKTTDLRAGSKPEKFYLEVIGLITSETKALESKEEKHETKNH